MFMRLVGLSLLLVLGFMSSRLAAQSSTEPLDPRKTCSEAEAFRIGWPMLAGPYGNWQPLRTSTPLVDDLLQARVVWVSESQDLGTAKTGSKTFGSAADVTARLGPNAKATPGNWAPVIIAEGKVFASSFRLAGPVFKATIKGGSDTASFRLDAEDLVLALDARTGKTLWTNAEPGSMVLSGGKRGGFQVTPVYADGKVFSMGATGRIFAHDASTGARLWQSDIGPVHAALAKQRQAILDAAAAGKWTDPDGPGWHSSLVVADGVLVVPTYSGNDTGLRGLDPASGKLLWEVKAAISRYATPSLWRHADRQYLLCATIAGSLRLIDPRSGQVLWTVSGLGPNYFTLAPSDTHVLVTTNPTTDPTTDPKAKRVPGYYGAYRITPAGAERAWAMPQQPEYQIPTWMDTCARQRYTLRDGIAYLSTEGTRDAPGHFMLLDQATGKVLADHVNRGSGAHQIQELWYLIGDRIIARSDSSHGPTHGGRHPFFQWTAVPGAITLHQDQGQLTGMDLVEFASAYEVLMETPIVDGRMFERTIDGRVVCSDLRQPAQAVTTWDLQVVGGAIGMPAPLRLKLWSLADGTVFAGKTLPPSDKDVGLPFGTVRRFHQWERSTPRNIKITGPQLAGVIDLGFGTHAWPVRLELHRQGDNVAGTWTRDIAPLATPVETSGSLIGFGPREDRAYPTPWLAEQPWTSFGTNPPGVTSWILQLDKVVPSGKGLAGLTLSLDHDGVRFTRGSGTGFSQAWHEVDASALQLNDRRITGSLIVVVNPDLWMTANPATGTGIAVRIEIDAAADNGKVTGVYKARVGAPHTATGQVTGKIVTTP